jgi:hypothetical protein
MGSGQSSLVGIWFVLVDLLAVTWDKE